MAPRKRRTATEATYEQLLEIALEYPGAWEDNPWGERVVKTGKKVFVFSGYDREQDEFSLSVKLPSSSEEALSQPFCVPTGYGLGRSGWVSITFGANDDAPVDWIEEWIEESFRAVATKTLIKKLDARLQLDP